MSKQNKPEEAKSLEAQLKKQVRELQSKLTEERAINNGLCMGLAHKDVLERLVTERTASLQQEVDKWKGKVTFFRANTAKLMALVMEDKDIGNHGQGLFEAITDKITGLQQEVERLKEENKDLRHSLIYANRKIDVIKIQAAELIKGCDIPSSPKEDTNSL